MIDQLDSKKLRALRTRIKGTTSLAAAGENIAEEPGSWWSADIVERKVKWTPFSPYQPFEALSDDLILYLVAHEASHLKWTGGYDVSGLSSDQAGRFHRFVNAVEDIRVDRLSGRQYLGFDSAKQQLRMKFREQYLRTDPSGWHPLDQIALNWIYSLDLGERSFGTKEMAERSEQLWPTISRIANVASTQEVADALLPIFLDLEGQQEQQSQEQQPESGDAGESGDESGDDQGQGDSQGQGDESGDDDEGQGDAGESSQDDESESGDESGEGAGQGGESGDESGEGAGQGQADESVGADEPSDKPVKSSGSTPGSMDMGEELEGMAEDAIDQRSERRLDDMIYNRNSAQDSAQDAVDLQLGPGDLAEWERNMGEDDYRILRERTRPAAVALSNRLKSVLRHNAQEAWEGGKRRGRLNSSKAWRAQAGNPRIFRSKHAVGGHDYTVGLLVDTSSSMRKQMEPTAEAAVMIAEALERAGLGVFVITWNSQLKAMKRLSQSLASASGNLGATLRAEGGTSEHLALDLATTEFQKAGRESRKLLITITDGETTDVPASTELLHEMERRMGVAAVAVKVGEGAYAKHYADSVVVEDAHELAKLLPQLVNRVVRKGR